MNTQVLSSGQCVLDSRHRTLKLKLTRHAEGHDDNFCAIDGAL